MGQSLQPILAYIAVVISSTRHDLDEHQLLLKWFGEQQVKVSTSNNFLCVQFESILVQFRVPLTFWNVDSFFSNLDASKCAPFSFGNLERLVISPLYYTYYDINQLLPCEVSPILKQGSLKQPSLEENEVKYLIRK